jgi:hypothetical protein
MATGRLVVGHAAPDVRARFGEHGVPQLEATPRTLRTVLSAVLDDRDQARELAAQGPAFARRHHDGRRSAAALAPFLATRGHSLDARGHSPARRMHQLRETSDG